MVPDQYFNSKGMCLSTVLLLMKRFVKRTPIMLLQFPECRLIFRHWSPQPSPVDWTVNHTGQPREVHTFQENCTIFCQEPHKWICHSCVPEKVYVASCGGGWGDGGVLLWHLSILEPCILQLEQRTTPAFSMYLPTSWFCSDLGWVGWGGNTVNNVEKYFPFHIAYWNVLFHGSGSFHPFSSFFFLVILLFDRNPPCQHQSRVYSLILKSVQ